MQECTIAPYREDERKVGSRTRLYVRERLYLRVSQLLPRHGALKSPREDQRRGRRARANAVLLSQFFSISLPVLCLANPCAVSFVFQINFLYFFIFFFFFFFLLIPILRRQSFQIVIVARGEQSEYAIAFKCTYDWQKGKREIDDSRSRSVWYVANRFENYLLGDLSREGAISLANMREDSRAGWKIIMKTQRNGGD